MSSVFFTLFTVTGTGKSARTNPFSTSPSKTNTDDEALTEYDPTLPASFAMPSAATDRVRLAVLAVA